MILKMAKESIGGGGGEAEQEEEERWRKRDDKDTKGRTGCGEVDGRRQHMRLRRLDLGLFFNLGLGFFLILGFVFVIQF